MEPFSALLMGGSSLLGSMFSSMTSSDNSAANIAMQQQTNQMSAAEAQKNRDFQEQMSNTAYQRARADMTSAGLNPMMMTGGAMNASSPGGSQASFQAPRQDKQSMLSGIGHAMNSAFEGLVKTKQMDIMAEQAANVHQDTANKESIQDILRDTHATNQPDVRDSLIRMGYPKELANALVYGGDIAKGVGQAGSAIGSLLDLIPGGISKVLRGAGPSAKEVGAGATAMRGRIDAGTATPEITREIEKSVQATGTASAGSVVRNRAVDKLERGLDAFIRKFPKLGGRLVGTGGSYD